MMAEPNGDHPCGSLPCLTCTYLNETKSIRCVMCDSSLATSTTIESVVQPSGTHGVPLLLVEAEDPFFVPFDFPDPFQASYQPGREQQHTQQQKPPQASCCWVENPKAVRASSVHASSTTEWSDVKIAAKLDPQTPTKWDDAAIAAKKLPSHEKVQNEGQAAGIHLATTSKGECQHKPPGNTKYVKAVAPGGWQKELVATPDKFGDMEQSPTARPARKLDESRSFARDNKLITKPPHNEPFATRLQNEEFCIENDAAAFASQLLQTEDVVLPAAAAQPNWDESALLGAKDENEGMQTTNDDEAVAARLQKQEEFGFEDDDAGFAKTLQEEDAIVQNPEQQRWLQYHIQHEQQRIFMLQREAEESAMMSSSSGVAWKVVEKVLKVAKSLNFAPLGIDQMVFHAERFLEKQAEFKKARRKLSSVTIAYHNTKTQNLEGIQENGLMAPSEHRTYQADNNYQRSAHYLRVGRFGEGIYTANNPEAFKAHGSCGLLVAILRGKTERIPILGMQLDATIDTGIGNKREGRNVSDFTHYDLYNDETVLRTASQCLPLVYYNALAKSHTADQLWKCHLELQKVMDTFCNKISDNITPMRIRPDSTQTVRRSTTSASNRGTQHLMPVSVPVPRYQSLRYIAQQGQPQPQQTPHLGAVAMPNTREWLETFSYTAPETLALLADNCCYTMLSEAQIMSMVSSDAGMFHQCSICFEEINAKQADHEQPVAQLVKCKHIYHQECLQKALTFSTKCPVCREHVVEPRGTSPSGIMTVTWSNQTCEGQHASTAGTFVIEYRLPGGTQKEYHPNPGVPFDATHRVAYVPSTGEARQLLKRLAWAWIHGMTFTVGTSMTTSQPNCLVWASIHHKTSRTAGPHGFPDPYYFANANDELSQLSVPECDNMVHVELYNL